MFKKKKKIKSSRLKAALKSSRQRKKEVVAQGSTVLLQKQKREQDDVIRAMNKVLVAHSLDAVFTVWRGEYASEEDGAVCIFYSGETGYGVGTVRDAVEGVKKAGEIGWSIYQEIVFEASKEYPLKPYSPDSWTFGAYMAEAQHRGHDALLEKYWQFIFDTTPHNPGNGNHKEEYFDRIYPRLQELWTEVVEAIGYSPDIKVT
jgi:hypothetical protein